MSFELLQKIPDILKRLEAVEATIASGPSDAPAPAPASNAVTYRIADAVDIGTIAALDRPGAVVDASGNPAPAGKSTWQELLGLGLAFATGNDDDVKVDTGGSPLQFTAKNELGETATITISGALDAKIKF